MSRRIFFVRLYLHLSGQITQASDGFLGTSRFPSENQGKNVRIGPGEGVQTGTGSAQESCYPVRQTLHPVRTARFLFIKVSSGSSSRDNKLDMITEQQSRNQKLGDSSRLCGKACPNIHHEDTKTRRIMKRFR